MPHYLLDAANNATELPFADLDSVQSILNTMPTLAPEAPVLQDSAPPSETGVVEC